MSMMQPDGSGMSLAQPGQPGQSQPGQGGGTGMSPEEHLRAAIEHLQAAQVTEPDDQDSQTIAKCAASLYAIVSGRQKEQDQMLGNPGLQRALRRSG